MRKILVKRRRLFLIASLALIIAVIFGVLVTLPEQSRVTKANFDRIEKGMTKAEVEKIFPGEASSPWHEPPLSALRGSEKCIIWMDDARTQAARRCAHVFFDKDGKVSHATWTDETNHNKIRRWLNGELERPW